MIETGPAPPAAVGLERLAPVAARPSSRGSAGDCRSAAARDRRRRPPPDRHDLRRRDVRGDDGAGVVRLRGHARVAERHEPAARAARQRGAGARARGAQRRHEGRLDHGHRAVQHDGARRGSALRPVPGRPPARSPASRIRSRSSCGSAPQRADGITYAFNRADRPPPWNTRPSSDDPFPVVLGPRAGRAGRARGRRPRAGDRRVAVSRARALDRRDARTRSSRTRSSRPAPPHAPARLHGLHGQHAVGARAVFRSAGQAGGEDRRQPRRPVDLRCPTTRDGRSTSAPVEPDGAGDLHTRFPLLFIDPALVKSIASRPVRVREWTVHVRSLPDQTLARDAAGRAADVLPDHRSPPAPACWRSCSRCAPTARASRSRR